MKKLITVVLALSLMLVCVPMMVSADTSVYGTLDGNIPSDGSAGTLTFCPSAGGANEILTFTFSNIVPVSEQVSSFTATVSGSTTLNGTINGKMNINGCDSVYAFYNTEFTIDGQPVYITGNFVQTGVSGDFVGKIMVGDAPAAVTDITIDGLDAITVNETALMSAILTYEGGSTPIAPEVTWAVWSNDRVYADIDMNTGLLTPKAEGAGHDIVVIANSLDPNVATATKTITISGADTEVSATVEPTYTIIIPSAVDFGTLQKDTGIKSQTFTVSASNVTIDSDASIDVVVNSDFLMGSLAYELYNSTSLVGDGGTYASFAANGDEIGAVKVNTANITAAGGYAGTMIFTVSYAIH